MSHLAVHRLRRAILWGGLVPAILLACHLGSAADALVEDPGWSGPQPTCISDLKHLCCEQLQQVYGCGWSGSTPCGCVRGEVVYLAHTRAAKMKVRIANAVWKGKCFADDGSFINQWAGFKALHSVACEGSSWFDGKPCVVMEYPKGTPVFANMRDEIRQVGPCLWVGMFFDREPCPKFRGFFALECRCDKHGCRH